MAGPARQYRLRAAGRRHGHAGPCVASSDAARAPHRHDARRRAAALGPAQCRHGDARGLEVSPGGLLQNELVQRQIGNRLAQPAVLELKVLQALHLLGLQPAELLAPPIIRHLAHPDLADCVRHGLSLRDQNFGLSQIRNNVLRHVSDSCLFMPSLPTQYSLNSNTYLKSNHFSGRGSPVWLSNSSYTLRSDISAPPPPLSAAPTASVACCAHRFKVLIYLKGFGAGACGGHGFNEQIFDADESVRASKKGSALPVTQSGRAELRR